MDIQRKKGILEVCVLAVLKKGPSYGYMIIRELEQCMDISESTLYPILKRLEQNGSLQTYRQEYNGRLRKYYCLTGEGQKKIDAFLDEWDELLGMYQFVAQQNRMTMDAGEEKPDCPEEEQPDREQPDEVQAEEEPEPECPEEEQPDGEQPDEAQDEEEPKPECPKEEQPGEAQTDEEPKSGCSKEEQPDREDTDTENRTEGEDAWL